VNAVSSESAAIVQRAAEVWNTDGLEAFMACLHPEIDWTPDPDWPEAGTSHGRGEVRSFLETFADAWENVTIKIDELNEVADHVVIRFRWLLRGKSSGIEQELPVTGVLETSEGLVSSGRFFLDHEEALRAAGVEGED
jgi:ketosteroid isomerase-like protein